MKNFQCTGKYFCYSGMCSSNACSDYTCVKLTICWFAQEVATCCVVINYCVCDIMEDSKFCSESGSAVLGSSYIPDCCTYSIRAYTSSNVPVYVGAHATSM